ncbi:type I restriction enzyme M protein [Bathymodiolus platifrons methanotrophic gill symbiont]|uniref:type I restriction-modification system subunit M n=2 Tax=Bathymodiolus platifrons methanotrophic gill symbiont TaxID=113268 RepID=UPI000B41F21F|nr:class I SAM-dependent DNA methyltransferase [Bathymodiolus platifrons methanotrophic gill symbiont]GAW86557.1 type I restriction enzyme M protein [Bathymodiolus platifrons methanotrophic gill symbiont]
MINKERLNNLSNEIWKGAIKLRGKFKAKDYPSVILPMIMIRRIECVLETKREAFKAELLQKTPDISDADLKKRIKLLETTKLAFYNQSDWTLTKILEDSSSQVEANFREYINSYSPNIDEIIEKFDYRNTITQIVKAKRLASIIELAADEDFSPERLSNIEMGYVYEELLQKFSQDDAKDTGEHFTPREIIRVMVELMDINFDPATATQALSIYDPACGTGGMLSIAKEHIIDKAKNEHETKQVEELILLNGQEYLAQNYAMCKADMILKGESHINITHGNSLIPHIESIEDDGDQHYGSHFDYMISNPPFGVNWSDYKDDALKFIDSRYQWGTPDISDGAFLFLLSMIEKMKSADQGGSKIAILFNGSPLSNGDAMQGASEIRRHILEKDLLDSIIMMPDQMFYNTGIYTYIWILNNNKPEHKKGQVLIINARQQYEKEPKAFGNKRNRLSDEHRHWIHNKFTTWQADENCKKFSTTDFAFHKVKIVYWQADEQNEPMWLREPLPSQLSNANIKKQVEFYGDFTLYIDIQSPFEQDSVIAIELQINGAKAFETLLAERLKAHISQLKGDTLNEIKKWVKAQHTKAEFYHRHYLADTEYIPFDAMQTDKPQHINLFLAAEIDYPIIRWKEVEQLGYEILPNKYFYQYVEPTSSEQLLNEFWALEKQAEDLLTGIKEL